MRALSPVDVRKIRLYFDSIPRFIACVETACVVDRVCHPPLCAQSSRINKNTSNT